MTSPGAVQDAWIEFLLAVRWGWMFTGTFRLARRDPRRVLRLAVRRFVKEFRGRSWFVCVEPHASGDLHVHGLVGGAVPDDAVWSFRSRWQEWYGHAWLRRVGRLSRDHRRVVMYAVKYATKQGIAEWWDFRLSSADRSAIIGTPILETGKTGLGSARIGLGQDCSRARLPAATGDRGRAARAPVAIT